MSAEFTGFIAFALFINRLVEVFWKPAIANVAERRGLSPDIRTLSVKGSSVLSGVVLAIALVYLGDAELSVLREFFPAMPEWADVIGTGVAAGFSAEVSHELLGGLRELRSGLPTAEPPPTPEATA